MAFEVSPEPKVRPSADDSSIFVSIVVPVYNAMPYLTELLDSLDKQSLDQSLFEVIFVNDGSTDTGGALLDDFASGREHVNVIHQENSGWAGKPRNVGMDLARGQYVFFVDSDDWLGDEALTKMREFALANDSDVIAPKLVAEGGRRSGGSTFATTVVDAPLEHMLKTLMPQKMIRTQLLRGNNIRFREDKVRLEDGMALVQAYCAAKRNSVLGDYDYYHIRARSDGANISNAPIEPAGYTASLAHIAQTLLDEVPDAEYAKDLVAKLFARKGLKVYRGKRFLKYRESKRQEWISAHRRFLEEFLPNDLHRFSGIRRKKVESILKSDLGELLRLSQLEVNEELPTVLEKVTPDYQNLVFTVKVPRYMAEPASLIVEQRTTKEQTVIPLSTRELADSRFQEVAGIVALAQRQGILDLSILLQDGRLKRIEFPQDMAETVHHRARLYRTRNGYASIDTKALQLGVVHRGAMKAWNVLSRALKR